MGDYIREDFEKIVTDDNRELYTYTDSENVRLPGLEYKDFMLLAKVVKLIVSSEFPRIAKLSNYLTEIAKLMNDLNLPIP